MQTEFAQYCKSQDLAKDFGETASKAEKKNVNLRIVSYRNITKLLYLTMKTKGKEAEKKRQKEEKRSEEKKVMSGIELRTSDRQNRFHLLLKYFRFQNSLRDVPSAPLFVDAVSAGAFGRRSRSRGFLGVKSSPARMNNSGFLCLLFCCMRNGLSFTDS